MVVTRATTRATTVADDRYITPRGGNFGADNVYTMMAIRTCSPTTRACNEDSAKDRPIITRLNLGTPCHINAINTTTSATIPTPAFNGDVAATGGDFHPGTIDIHSHKTTGKLRAIVGIQNDVAGGGGDVCSNIDGAAG